VPQRSIPAVYMRGGTSKGIFVRTEHLPAPGPERDAMILEMMGSPDAAQIDGMGGGMTSTSKLMAVKRSERPGVHVDYLFAQAAVREALVDYGANCGNLTSAIGVFAIDEGLIDAVTEPVTVVELYNENTNIRVRAHIPVVDGKAAVQGDHSIAGVPRPGAMIVNEYLDPAGSQFGVLYPTGEPLTVLETRVGSFEVSIIDVANTVVFLRAADLGLGGDTSADVVNSDAELLARVEAIRGAAAVKLGLVERAEDAEKRSNMLPMVSIIAPPTSYMTPSGKRVDADDIDVSARAFTGQRMHHAYPMTVMTCTAAAARLPGTIPNEIARADDGGPVRVGHAKGIAEADVHIDQGVEGPRVASVSVTRTARRLMRGEVFYRSR